MRLQILTALIAFACSADLLRSADAPVRDHDITVEDYFSQADIMEIAMSPDGRWVAYSEGRWKQSTNDRKADLWIVSTEGGPARRLTADRAGDHLIRWGGGGRWIYFVGSRKREAEKQPPWDGKPQVWRIGTDGGNLEAVTRHEKGIQTYDVARDGKHLFFSAETEDIGSEWRSLWHQYSDLTYGHGIAKHSEVWRLDLDSWRTERIVANRRHIYDLALAPDQGRLAMITAPDDTVITFEGRSRVDLCDLASGKIESVSEDAYRKQMPSPYAWLEKLAWSADSKSLAFGVVFDGYPAEIVVADCSAAPYPARVLKRPPGLSLHGYGTPIQWRGKGSEIVFLGEEKARIRLCSMPVSGEPAGASTWTPGDVVVSLLSLDDSGERAAVVHTDPTHFNDVYLVTPGSEPRALTHVNPQVDRWKLPKMSIVSWTGAKGDPVEGILELPPDYQDRQRVPLVVEIHGGPTMAMYYGLQYWIYGRTLLPAKGYAELIPNYRGSTGYGDKFLTELVGHENELDVEDILKGVDAMVEKGIADPERLGVSGWSNGGYLTDCIVTKTTRFKAASSGAGIVDTIMEWGANDEPAYAIVFKQGFPWTNPETYHRTSSTYRLDKIRTPTLIHVGGNDDRCPPGHSKMLFRALHEYLHVPTELVIYPGEPHGLTTYKHRQAKMEWDLAWFAKYLKK
jgi:dipeptidyl aminopeptidase/acylaminoacyl peptidase